VVTGEGTLIEEAGAYFPAAYRFPSPPLLAMLECHLRVVSEHHLDDVPKLRLVESIHSVTDDLTHR
jgi:hypothetical protein